MPDDLCDFSGHDWAPMGGGMQICMICEREREDPDEVFAHVTDKYFPFGIDEDPASAW